MSYLFTLKTTLVRNKSKSYFKALSIFFTPPCGIDALPSFHFKKIEFNNIEIVPSQKLGTVEKMIKLLSDGSMAFNLNHINLTIQDTYPLGDINYFERIYSI